MKKNSNEVNFTKTLTHIKKAGSQSLIFDIDNDYMISKNVAPEELPIYLLEILSEMLTAEGWKKAKILHWLITNMEDLLDTHIKETNGKDVSK